jgi:hypothetical protein
MSATTQAPTHLAAIYVGLPCHPAHAGVRRRPRHRISPATVRQHHIRQASPRPAPARLQHMWPSSCPLTPHLAIFSASCSYTTSLISIVVLWPVKRSGCGSRVGEDRLHGQEVQEQRRSSQMRCFDPLVARVVSFSTTPQSPYPPLPAEHARRDAAKYFFWLHSFGPSQRLSSSMPCSSAWLRPVPARYSTPALEHGRSPLPRTKPTPVVVHALQLRLATACPSPLLHAGTRTRTEKIFFLEGRKRD